MHSGVFWVSSFSGIHSALAGGFLALSSLGCTGHRSGLHFRPLMHSCHHQSLIDRSFPQGLLHSYWPGQFPLCAVQALVAYLVIRGDGPSPLFLCQNRRPLSHALLSDWLKRILASAGISGNFSSHSFHIGAATVAGRNGIPDHLIQELGRWKCNAYQGYIRNPLAVLSSLSQKLA